MPTPTCSFASADGSDVLLRVKAVPGASRDALAGPLGDRLKVRVSAPPEGGKANKAICALVASALGVAPRQVAVEQGTRRAEKVLRVRGIDLETVAGLAG